MAKKNAGPARGASPRRLTSQVKFETNLAVETVYDSCFSKHEKFVLHCANNDVSLLNEKEKDRLFEKAVTVVEEYDRASVALLQEKLGICPLRADRIMDQLIEHGIVGAADGTNPQVVLHGKTLEEARTAHKVQADRLRSYVVQQQLLEKHEAKAALLTISDLVKEEIIQILGAYLRKGFDHDEMIRRIDEEPGILAQEIGSRVGNTVAGILAASDGWPNSVDAGHHRRSELVLTASEISHVVHLMHWMNAAFFARKSAEREKRPGWDNHWLWERLKAANCYVSGQHWSGWVADPAISHVIVRRDGSVTKVGLDGSITETGPVSAKNQVRPLVTRQIKRSPNSEQWRSEITHEWIEGKGWVRVVEPEGTEH